MIVPIYRKDVIEELFFFFLWKSSKFRFRLNTRWGSLGRGEIFFLGKSAHSEGKDIVARLGRLPKLEYMIVIEYSVLMFHQTFLWI